MTILPADIVAFTAHPDDVELNCAGTLAKAVSAGWRAAAVEMTAGELSTRGTVENRAREAAAAAEALGLEQRFHLGLPDGHVRDDDASRKAVVEVLRAMRPRVVIAPPLEDHHADHMATAQILTNAFYLAGVEKYAPGLPPWRPRTLLHYLGSRADVPSLVVDVTSVYEKRRQATLCFRSQFYQEGSDETTTRISHPEFLEAIDGRSRYFGTLIGVGFGEAYRTVEPLPVQDLVSLFSVDPWGEGAGASATHRGSESVSGEKESC